MKVSDIMSDRVITVGQDEPVITAARLFKRYNLGAMPVCDDTGRLQGMLTDRDIVLRCTASGADPKNVKIRDIMSRGIVTTTPDCDIDSAAKQMSADQVRRLPVVDGGRLIGMLSLCDMARHCDMEAAAALAEISSNVTRKRVEEK
ncbi:MAG TPA: CBS domain-containing protein [Clostridiales bacterium]|jgi:CBS domain-containing protein|nr:CBS domain-containing protein [Clostridiales bacterium]HBR07835.1 CBS domain-containing protein [Clostridiales bacterium]